MYVSREFVEAGGLMSYGVSLPSLFQRSAYFVDRILKGAKPADLPVEQPTKVRARHQPEDGEGSRPDDPALGAGACGSGDRIAHGRSRWETAASDCAHSVRGIPWAGSVLQPPARQGQPVLRCRCRTQLVHGPRSARRPTGAHPATSSADSSAPRSAGSLAVVDHRRMALRRMAGAVPVKAAAAGA
jgi:hypothetical protein